MTTPGRSVLPQIVAVSWVEYRSGNPQQLRWHFAELLDGPPTVLAAFGIEDKNAISFDGWADEYVDVTYDDDVFPGDTWVMGVDPGCTFLGGTAAAIVPQSGLTESG